MKNYYQTLGLESNCTNEQIKSAFKEYAKHYHPDKHQGNTFFANKFIEVKEAYDALKDSQTRKRHDKFHNLNQTANSSSNSHNQGYRSQNQPNTSPTAYNEKQEYYNREKGNESKKKDNGSLNQDSEGKQKSIYDIWGYPIFFVIGMLFLLFLVFFTDKFGITNQLLKNKVEFNTLTVTCLVLSGTLGMIWYHFQDD